MASPDIAETVEGQEAPKKQTLSVGGNFGGLWVFRAIHHVPKRPPVGHHLSTVSCHVKVVI